jgi:hypothetical protein
VLEVHAVFSSPFMPRRCIAVQFESAAAKRIMIGLVAFYIALANTEIGGGESDGGQ